MDALRLTVLRHIETPILRTFQEADTSSIASVVKLSNPSFIFLHTLRASGSIETEAEHVHLCSLLLYYHTPHTKVCCRILMSRVQPRVFLARNRFDVERKEVRKRLTFTLKLLTKSHAGGAWGTSRAIGFEEDRE